MSAIFSDDRSHRFMLTRGLAGEPYVLFIGLNPSNAAEYQEDATTRRLGAFTEKWGFLHWKIGNLSAYVSTDPKQLFNRPQRTDIRCEEDLNLARAIIGATLIVPCWGSGVVHLGKVDMVWRPEQVLRLCVGHEHKLRCFGRTKDGHPKHPLYLANDTELHYWCDLA